MLLNNTATDYMGSLQGYFLCLETPRAKTTMMVPKGDSGLDYKRNNNHSQPAIMSPRHCQRQLAAAKGAFLNRFLIKLWISGEMLGHKKSNIHCQQAIDHMVSLRVRCLGHFGVKWWR